MSDLTRKEVEAWPPIGPMAIKAERVLEVIDARDEARATAEIHAAALDKARTEVEELRRELEHERRNAAQVRELMSHTRADVEALRGDLANGREVMRLASAEVDAATVKIAEIIAERDELKGQVAYLADALWRDDVGMSKALGQIRAHIRSRAWVLEGRGSLEWNDDTYRDEAGLAMRPALEIAEAALSSSGDLLHPTLRDLKANAKRWVDGLRFEAFAHLGEIIAKAFEVKDSDMVILQGLTLEPEHAERAIQTISKAIGATGRKPIVVGLSPLEPISVDIMRPAQREHLRDELNRALGLERLSSAELVELRSHVAQLLDSTSTSDDNRLGELLERLMGAPPPKRPELDAARVEVNAWWMKLVGGQLDLVRYAAIRHRDAADPFTLAAFDALRAHDERVIGLAGIAPAKLEPLKALVTVAHTAIKGDMEDERDEPTPFDGSAELGRQVVDAAVAALGLEPLDWALPAKPVVEPACSSAEHSHCSRCGYCEDRGSCVCYAR